MKKKWTIKDAMKQKEIHNRWVEECARAYNLKIDDVTDAHILSYLAQVEMGFHVEIKPKN